MYLVIVFHDLQCDCVCSSQDRKYTNILTQRNKEYHALTLTVIIIVECFKVYIVQRRELLASCAIVIAIEYLNIYNQIIL